MHSSNLWKFKIMGTVCVLVGIFLMAKFKLHLVGLVLLFIGFYLAMNKGMKPQ